MEIVLGPLGLLLAAMVDSAGLAVALTGAVGAAAMATVRLIGR